MQYFLSFVLCFSFWFPLKCQNLDSLWALLESNSITDEIRINAHLDIVNALEYKEPTDSLLSNGILIATNNNNLHAEYNLRSSRIAKELATFRFSEIEFDAERMTFIASNFPDSLHYELASLNAKGHLSWAQRDYAKATRHYEMALSFATKYNFTKQIGPLLNRLGTTNLLTHKHFASINYFQKALSYPSTDKAKTYVLIGDSYFLTEDWDNLLETADSAIYHINLSGNNSSIINALLFKGEALHQKQQYIKSLANFEEALSYCDSPKTKRKTSSCQSGILKNYLAMSDYSSMKTMRSDVYTFKDNCAFIESSSWLAKAYLESDQFSEALQICKDGKEKSLQCKNPYYDIFTNECLQLSYAGLKNYKLAYQYKQLYHEAQDSFFGKKKWITVSRAINQRELQAQEEILNLKQEQQSLKYQNKINRLTLLGISGGILVLLISMFSAQLKKRNQKINQQNLLISESLSEKELLLKEIHHRVKNNLQVISSLLSIQSRQTVDQDVKKAIIEGKSRVRSMSLIHQHLYQLDNLSGVSVQTYINALITEIKEAYGITNNQIEFKTSIDDLTLDVETMVPMGLIMNELLTNSIKHAFTNQRDGQIIVALTEQNEQLILRISDNGDGNISNQDTNTGSFGLKMIKLFMKKLQAEYSFEDENGFSTTISIANYRKIKS
jgi:two-component sensor histidine kinase